MSQNSEIQHLKDEILRLNKEIVDLKIVIQKLKETRSLSYQLSPEELEKCGSQVDSEVLFKSSHC